MSEQEHTVTVEFRVGADALDTALRPRLESAWRAAAHELSGLDLAGLATPTISVDADDASRWIVTGTVKG